MDNEIWIPIQSENGLFSISSCARIKNNTTGKILKQSVNKTGYYQIVTKIGGRSGRNRVFRVHREYAIAFIPNPHGLPQVNHKDGNKLNNSIDNLEWCTAAYNTQHAHTLQLTTVHRGHENSQSKLSKEDRLFILKNYSRYDENCTGRALAERFGVDKMQIYRIIKRGY